MSGAASAVRLVVQRLRSDAANRLAWSMAAAIVARFGLLLLAVAIGRRFGPTDYGAFTFATGVATFVAQFSVLGFPMLMNRLIPEMLRDRNWDALRGLRDAGDAVVVGFSLATASLLLAAAASTVEYGVSFVLSALLVVPFASASLRRQQLAALRRPAAGLFFDQGFGALFAGIFLFVVGARSIIVAVVIFAAGKVAGNTITFFQVRRLLPAEVSTAKREVHLKKWLTMALPMLAGTSSKLLMNRVDILMLAPLAGLYQSGLYGAAFRITFVLTFPQVVMMSVVTPLISEAFAHGQHARITRLVRGAELFALITAVPAGLVLALFPGFVVTHVFGANFAAAAPSLTLLAIGQTVASLSIPLQCLLTMGGKERQFAALGVGTFVLHAALNLVLIPIAGATGAAAATALVYVLMALGQIVLNRNYIVGKV
jgi:O-antigen/teichoic acid export membrane protein